MRAFIPALLFASAVAFAQTPPAETPAPVATPAPAQTPAPEAKPDEKSTLEKAGTAVKNAGKKVSNELSQTRVRRGDSDYILLGTYSFVDLLVPGKYGLTAGLVKSEKTTWELEYLKGSVSVAAVVADLGEMSDTRISLIGRSYFGNSFHMSYGVSYFDFNVHLGDKYMNQVNSNYPSMDLLEMQALGFNLGIGNRWIFGRGFTVGLDWVSWSQPLVTLKRSQAFVDHTTNQQDKEDVEKAMRIISYFPRFTFLKLQLGFTF